jgi:hypothetical protein
MQSVEPRTRKTENCCISPIAVNFGVEGFLPIVIKEVEFGDSRLKDIGYMED